MKLFMLRPIREEWPVSRIERWVKLNAPRYARRGITIVAVPASAKLKLSTSPEAPALPPHWTVAQKAQYRRYFYEYIRGAQNAEVAQ